MAISNRYTGNLTQDVSENIQTGGISWTPNNKIDRIVKLTGGGAQIMKLAYLTTRAGSDQRPGPKCNRVIKDHYATDTSSSPTRTYYIRDAQGNVMGIFKRASGETYAERQETPIYGSSRLGVSYKGALHTAVATDTLAHFNTLYTRELRQRGYELTDHLGNVRATVSDMLLPRGSDVFDADLRTLTDYYPFGMTMPGRSYEAAGIDGHRYGYNGKENDNEVKGEGNQQDYGFRIYDPRVARFLSVDPLAPDYPWYTPYQFAGNTPIQAIDLDGLEPLRPSNSQRPPRRAGSNSGGQYGTPPSQSNDNGWRVTTVRDLFPRPLPYGVVNNLSPSTGRSDDLFPQTMSPRRSVYVLFEAASHFGQESSTRTKALRLEISFVETSTISSGGMQVDAKSSIVIGGPDAFLFAKEQQKWEQKLDNYVHSQTIFLPASERALAASAIRSLAAINPQIGPSPEMQLRAQVDQMLEKGDAVLVTNPPKREMTIGSP